MTRLSFSVTGGDFMHYLVFINGINFAWSFIIRHDFLKVKNVNFCKYI